MTRLEPYPGTPAAVFAARRAAVMERLGKGVMVLPAAPLQRRSHDTERRYRPDSELFYVSGMTEPDSVAVLVGAPEPRFVIFVPERDDDAELWAGPRLGPEAAAEQYGADQAHGIGTLGERLPLLLREADELHVRLGRNDAVQRMALDALAWARARGSRRGVGPRRLSDPGRILDDLRMIKDDHEIARIRAAADVTVHGHRAAVKAARPGVGEWAVEAAVNAAFRERGGDGPGFPTIVGAGGNACVLHYVRNDTLIRDGDLVLVDAGAEVALYQGDVTRTLPASGRFAPEQRAVYEIVRAALHAAVEAAAPGVATDQVHDAAVRVLVEGLVSLEVLRGDPQELVAEGAHKLWFPHQTSHWLGIDVHDPGDYARAGVSRVLEPGMVLTVEPGLYFRRGAGHDASFDGIGVRLEDDVLITEGGAENLTAALPTDPDVVESAVRDSA